MPPSHLDWWICILNLHNGALSILVAKDQSSGFSREEQEMRQWNRELLPARAGGRSLTALFLDYIRNRSPR